MRRPSFKIRKLEQEENMRRGSLLKSLSILEKDGGINGHRPL